jgi:hypothetical protein
MSRHAPRRRRSLPAALKNAAYAGAAAFAKTFAEEIEPTDAALPPPRRPVITYLPQDDRDGRADPNEE